MSTVDHAVLIDKTLQTLRIIVGVMVVGLLAMIAVSATIGPSQAKAAAPAAPVRVPADAKLPVITVLALLMAATLVPLSVALSGITTDTLRKKRAAGASKDEDDVPALMTIFQTKTIIASALTEAPAFFAAIAYLIEGNPMALALAGVLTVIVAMRFPVRRRVEHWLAGQLERLGRDRV